MAPPPNECNSFPFLGDAAAVYTREDISTRSIERKVTCSVASICYCLFAAASGLEKACSASERGQALCQGSTLLVACMKDVETKGKPKYLGLAKGLPMK